MMSDDTPTEPITVGLPTNEDEKNKTAKDLTEIEEKPLYMSALHIKFFYKMAARPFFMGIIPVVLTILILAGGVVFQILSTQANHTPSLDTSTKTPSWNIQSLPWVITLVIIQGVWFISSLPWLATLVIILIPLLWIAVCAFMIYRSFFEWQHTGIILTWRTLSLIRPNSRILFLKRQGRKAIESQKISGYDTDSPTTWELYIFRNSITFSVTIAAQEGRGKSPVDHLPDVRNPDEFGAALDLVIARNQNRKSAA